MARCNYRPVLGDMILPNGQADTLRSIFRRGDIANVGFDAITDGTSNTVVFAESVIWNDPSDNPRIIGGVGILTSLATDSKPNICTALISGSGTITSTAITGTDNPGRMSGKRIYDGRTAVLSVVTVLPPNSPSCGSNAMWDGANSLNTASSYHTGGANTLYGDDSVHFTSQTINAGDPSTDVATETSSTTGKPAVGRTDAQGKFVLTATQGGEFGKGTMIGKYLVSLSKEVPSRETNAARTCKR